MELTAAGPGTIASTEAMRAIHAEFAVALGSEERVATACDRLRADRHAWRDPEVVTALRQLAALVAGESRPLVRPLFDLVEDIALDSPEPLPFMLPMLRAGPHELAIRALDALLQAVRDSRLIVDEEVVGSIAAIAEGRARPFSDPEAIERLAQLLGDTARERYLHSPNLPVRRLAARVLDRSGHLPRSSAAAEIVGAAAYGFLAPYLEFTRATHLDLLAIRAAPGGEPQGASSLRAVEHTCGAPLLRELVSSLGWSALNLGLDVRPLSAVTIGGGLPLLLSPAEAALFDGCPGAARTGDCLVFIAHGAQAEGAAGATGSDAKIERFRACNLRHARVLAEFLDLAPLTTDRADRLFQALAELVEDFVALFPGEADECRRVQAVFDRIGSRARAAGAAWAGPGVAPEVVRLVQPFEDPSSVDAVRTLHGLKRYLHQRGLHLGFQLVQAGRNPTRTVALAIARDGRITQVARPVEYADFDPEPGAPGEMPYAVKVVADGFARQLLHGEANLPSVRIYCYRNEVHYFVSFRNHPAFVRIDYSPPFAGGMIDLEYYGVSKYELSHHPNVSLDGVRTFFRRLDFDVSVENTRIHARYDKERARDLADLCARAEALFRLTPYLMDIDWVLGNLDLSREARHAAMEAWADRFARWGVLPLTQLLSANRQGIRLRDTPHPAGPRECTWRGDPPYGDRLTPEPCAEAAAWISDRLRARGLDTPLTFGEHDLAQIPFEIAVLTPLHEAAATAENGHDAGRFAELARSPDVRVLEAARLARVLAPLDRFLRFETTGNVNGHLVQRTRLALPGGSMRMAVVREDSGQFGLALVEDLSGGSRREQDSARVSAVLRAHNFPVGDASPLAGVDPAMVAEWLSTPGVHRGLRPVEGERLATGVRAAPGVATGLARVGTAHRTPRDLDGAVLVADRLSPEDGPFLTRAAGVVCTGGGVLSHAGLLAAQFAKPAVVIDGEWATASDLSPRVRFWSTEYDEFSRVVGPFAIQERRGLRRREEWLLDGDVVEVDAEAAVVRVLGQDREALALVDALRQFDLAEARLATASTPEQLLVERGRRAHAVHQLSRLLPQLVRPDLVSFAVRKMLSGAVASAGGAALLQRLLDGRAADAARSAAIEWFDTLATRYQRSLAAARQRLPVSSDPFEILALRLGAIRDADALAAARAALDPSRPIAAPSPLPAALSGDMPASIELTTVQRLANLADRAFRDLSRAAARGEWARARHLLDAVDRHHRVLPPAVATRAAAEEIRTRLTVEDRIARTAHGERHILTPADGGAELQPLIGPKAANLGEILRLAPDVPVPPWFAVTHAALQDALAVRIPDRGIPLGEAIGEVLGTPGLDDRQRARAIDRLWEALVWPPDLEAEIRAGYRVLADSADGDPAAPRDARGNLLVAVRSSAFEEDRPETMRAGEFDTFLFVGGEESVLAHVKKAWSGFWTPRAIHGRTLLGIGSRLPGGGILVQRMVDARSAGVVQTINVADARPGEIAIDVAFGLGEGVVSGRVSADHVTVVKGDPPAGGLRFRYATADKRDRIVFDRVRGTGTSRADTLYHQRMRPSLEYSELETLVRLAERLERLWEEALDLEFALDAERIWVLQARPVPAFHAAWHQTARRYPLRQEVRP